MNQRTYEQEYDDQNNNQFVNQRPTSNNNLYTNQNELAGQDQSGRQNRLSTNMQNSYDQETNNIQRPYNISYDGAGGQTHADQNQHINNMYAQFQNQREDQEDFHQNQHQHENQINLGQEHHREQYVQEMPIGQTYQAGAQEQTHNQSNGHHVQNLNNYSGQQFNNNQLDDAEMELPEEQSQEERESNYNINRYIVRQNEAVVGFLRKLNIGAYGKKSVIRSKIDQLFDTLDEKAKLQNQFKTLVQYERKLDLQPAESYDGKPIILIKWNEQTLQFELNEDVLNVFNKNKERRNSKVSFVSIAGEKKKGKTFLLNSLLQTGNNSQGVNKIH